MKKVTLIVLVALFAGSVLVSCKSHEKCPAYSKVSVKETKATC